VYRPPPDFEPRIYTPQRIAAVVATLAEDGIAPARALAGSGIDEAALQASQTRISYAQVAIVFRNALRLTREPTVALRAGARMHATAYGIWGYALLSSRSYAEMLEFAAKYRRVIGPMADMAYDPERDPATCGFEVLLSPDPRDGLYRFALDFTLSAHLTLTRDMYGEDFGFSAVRVAYPGPAHPDAYGGFFGCPVQFGQRCNELQFDAAWSMRAPRMQDGVTHAMARETCQQFLTDLTHSSGIASAVRRALVERMPWRFPSIESMAHELSMEPRTLRRRLEAQGTSYRQMLADVRRGMAIEYLRKTRMTTEDIASRLGYSDAANFRHAFARWTGSSPNAYRVGKAVDIVSIPTH
jgi:AraC-like DNA-binding protein